MHKNNHQVVIYICIYIYLFLYELFYFGHQYNSFLDDAYWAKFGIAFVATRGRWRKLILEFVQDD